jgi:hypothetical protein
MPALRAPSRERGRKAWHEDRAAESLRRRIRLYRRRRRSGEEAYDGRTRSQRKKA